MRTIITTTNNLAYKYPELVKYWDYEKNDKLGIYPDKVSFGMRKKVWWKCSKCKKEWKANICEKVKSDSYCTCQRTIKITTTNNLAYKYPELVKEWDYEKNDKLGLYPDKITSGSGRSVWWKCDKGHEWQQKISVRTSAKTGCPYCSGRFATKENNLSLHKDIIKYLHPTKNNGIDITKMMPGSHKKLWWICDKGHEYYKPIYQQFTGGCKYCNRPFSVFEMRVYSELKYIFKNVIWRDTSYGVECDVLLPNYNIGIEVDGAYWHKDSVNKDTKKNKRMKKNGITIVRLREKSLSAISNFDVVYKKGKEFEAIKELVKVISGMTNLDLSIYESQNNYMNDKLFDKLFSEISKPKKSILEMSPEIVKEWDYNKNGLLKPENLSCGSHKKVWWICKNGHSTFVSVRYKIKHPKCQVCNSIANNSELLKMWDYEKNDCPSTYTLGGGKVAWWKCNICGYEWKARINSRIKNGKIRKCRRWQSLIHKEHDQRLLEKIKRIPVINRISVINRVPVIKISA